MRIENKLQRASVMRARDLGGKVQIICTDDHGLLSVYMDYSPFCQFTRILCESGLKMKGTVIEYNRELVRVALPDRRWKQLATTAS
jgi:hypothetical protein